jgi:hypothetical protein
MSTERLYYNDSHLIEFDARVVDVTERVSGWSAIVWTGLPSTQLAADSRVTPEH